MWCAALQLMQYIHTYTELRVDDKAPFCFRGRLGARGGYAAIFLEYFDWCVGGTETITGRKMCLRAH